MEYEVQDIRIYTNTKHRCRVNQHLINLKLENVSINKILVTEFVAVKVSQNLNFM